MHLHALAAERRTAACPPPGQEGVGW
jgi:hypothetical protein